jgi:hypothetical protein
VESGCNNDLTLTTIKVFRGIGKPKDRIRCRIALDAQLEILLGYQVNNWPLKPSSPGAEAVSGGMHVLYTASRAESNAAVGKVGRMEWARKFERVARAPLVAGQPGARALGRRRGWTTGPACMRATIK